MNDKEQLLEKINECRFDEGITTEDTMLIRGYISFYKKTQDITILEKIKSYMTERMTSDPLEQVKLGYVLSFLLEETNEDIYKEAIQHLIDQVLKENREDGILKHKDGSVFTAQEAYDLFPVYAWYETNFNKKEHYIDILNQLRYLNTQILVQNQAKPSERHLFMMTLADTITNMSEEIFEYYAQLQGWLKEAVHKEIQNDSKESVQMAYIIRKGCESKALLPEKYNEIGKRMLLKAAEQLLTQDDLPKNELGILLMTYALTV